MDEPRLKKERKGDNKTDRQAERQTDRQSWKNMEGSLTFNIFEIMNRFFLIINSDLSLPLIQAIT